MHAQIRFYDAGVVKYVAKLNEKRTYDIYNRKNKLLKSDIGLNKLMILRNTFGAPVLC